MGFVVTCLSTRDVITPPYKNLMFTTLAALQYHERTQFVAMFFEAFWV
jgi:hypothetical protein